MYIFPSTVKHLPNELQMDLFTRMLYKEKFPGFLNPKSLRVSIHKDRKDNYELLKVTPACLSNALQNSPYLYIPFTRPIAYILSEFNNIIGIISRTHLETYWLENEVSLGELWTAQKNNMAIMVAFSSIGLNSFCTLCYGSGAIDWVDRLTVGNLYKEIDVPDTNYILASYKNLHFLINNKDIYEHDDSSVIHVCPKCLGMGCESVLIYHTGDKSKIELITFQERKKIHSLIVRDARNEIIETAPNFTFSKIGLASNISSF